MKEQGIISKVFAKNMVFVALKQSLACEKCGVCRAAGEGLVGIEANNEIGAKLGEMVEIEIPEAEVWKGSFAVYLVPIMFLTVGYLLGHAVMRLIDLPQISEISGMICGLVALVGGFFLAGWYDRSVVRTEALRAKVLRKISA